MLSAQLSVSLPLLIRLPRMHPRDFFEEGPGRCMSRLVVAPTSLKRLSYDVFGSWATDGSTGEKKGAIFCEISEAKVSFL